MDYNEKRAFKQTQGLQKSNLAPHDLDVEKRLLGAVLLQPQSFEDAKRVSLSSKDFYQDSHALIFEACEQLYESKIEINLLSVRHQLEKNKTLDAAGGVFSIVSLTTNVSTSSNVDYDSAILKELSMRRNLIGSLTISLNDAYDKGKDIFELQDRVKNKLSESVPTSVKGVSAFDATTQAIEKMKTRRELIATGQRIGSPTFSKVADVMSQGWERGEVIIFGLPSSHGKSLMAAADCLQGAKGGFKGAYVSLEMDASELGSRWLAMEAGVSYFRITKGNVQDNKVNSVIQAQEILKDALQNITVYNEYELNERKLEEICYLESKKGTHTIYLDYIQIVDLMISYGKSQLGALNDFTRNLKRLAKKYNVAIVALSQLNREAYNSNRPNKDKAGDIELFSAFIAASSTIENDSDKVILGAVYDKWGYEYTADQDPTTTKYEKLVQYKMTKNRGGATGAWRMWVNFGLGIYNDLEGDLEGAEQQYAKMTEGISSTLKKENTQPSKDYNESLNNEECPF